MGQLSRRALLGASAATLALLGVFFVGVLVGESSDNAYSYLALVGGALIVAALPFALGTLLPPGHSRRIVVRVALGLLFLVGILGTLLLVLAIAVIPSQNYESARVLISHVVGLIALVATVGTFAWIYLGRFR